LTLPARTHVFAHLALMPRPATTDNRYVTPLLRKAALGALVVTIAAVMNPVAHQSTAEASSSSIAHPCGRVSHPAPTTHVIWIWLENHSRSQVIGKPGSSVARAMPTLNRVARLCGEASNYRAVTHPSLPNYLAAVTGQRTGLPTATCSPAQCPQSGPTLFSQIETAGINWRTYAESMPAACSRTGVGRYAPRHNPAVYFRALRSSCLKRDLPLGPPTNSDLARRLTQGTLPGFTWIVPDLCDSGHDCSRTTADQWLTTWMTPLLTSRNYVSGNTVIFITWDEGKGGVGGQNCRTADDVSCDISTVVMSPSTRPGTVSSTRFDHVSLLRTTEQLLRLPATLGEVPTSASMRAAFNI